MIKNFSSLANISLYKDPRFSLINYYIQILALSVHRNLLLCATWYITNVLINIPSFLEFFLREQIGYVNIIN